MRYSLALLSVFLALPVYAATPSQCEADARAALALASTEETPVKDVSMLELIASQIGAIPNQVTRTILQSGDDIILQECGDFGCRRNKIGTISGMLASNQTPVTADAKAAAALSGSTASASCPCPCGCAVTGVCTCGKPKAAMQAAPSGAWTCPTCGCQMIGNQMAASMQTPMYSAPPQACMTCSTAPMQSYYTTSYSTPWTTGNSYTAFASADGSDYSAGVSGGTGPIRHIILRRLLPKIAANRGW